MALVVGDPKEVEGRRCDSHLSLVLLELLLLLVAVLVNLLLCFGTGVLYALGAVCSVRLVRWFYLGGGSGCVTFSGCEKG